MLCLLSNHIKKVLTLTGEIILLLTAGMKFKSEGFLPFLQMELLYN